MAPGGLWRRVQNSQQKTGSERRYTMRRWFCALVLIGWVVPSLCVAAEAQQPPKIRALLMTGDDVSAHPWREISETTREILVGSGKFDVRICEDPWILESQNALKGYDVIVFTIYS
jgi:hypothetical protein